MKSSPHVSLALALLVIGSWLAAHVLAVFVIDWSGATLVAAPLMIALICWLSVGLFIVAHDCMHGTLVPGFPAVNRYVGQLCLGLYAGFSFSRLNAKHHEHHDHAGTDGDPDYHEGKPPSFWRWFFGFVFEYFGWREWAIVTALFVAHVLLTGSDPVLLLAFWGVPAMLSALQLFYFGTYLPHRAGPEPFTDRHRARSNEYSWLVSLLTCFHFGYHREHHLYPYLPWWKLPLSRPGHRLSATLKPVT